MERKHLCETFYQLDIPVSIALVTDTHNHPADDVLYSLERNHPDIICIAGDFVYARLPKRRLKMKKSPYAMDLLKGCSKLAPVFVSIGNHEWMLNKRDMKMIRSAGVTLLDNEYVHYRHRKSDGVETELVIGGFSSSTHQAYRDYCAAQKGKSKRRYPYLRSKSPILIDSTPCTDWLDTFCSQKGYKILLCHHPEYYPRYLKDRDIDLILSGHAHGGQIRIFGQGLYAPGQGLFPRLTAGIVDGKLIISRGLSNNTRIPRVFNAEEIVYLK